MARNGKIARLSLDIRNELNRRLQDGEPGTNLVKWLNGQTSVQVVLKEEFGGRPISEQNLSEWRQGGYKDWLRLEAARDFIDDLSEQSGELDEAAGGELISDRFGSILATEMAQLAMKFLEPEEDLEKRWNRLKEINREFSRLRRDDHRGLRVWIKRAQWERQQEREEEAAEEKRRNRERAAGLFGAIRGMAPRPKAEGRMQNSEVSKSAALPPHPSLLPRGGEGIRSTSRDEPAAGRTNPGAGNVAVPGTGILRPNQGESGQIKVNQTKSDLKKGKAGVTIKVEGAGFKIEGKESQSHGDTEKKVQDANSKAQILDCPDEMVGRSPSSAIAAVAAPPGEGETLAASGHEQASGVTESGQIAPELIVGAKSMEPKSWPTRRLL